MSETQNDKEKIKTLGTVYKSKKKHIWEERGSDNYNSYIKFLSNIDINKKVILMPSDTTKVADQIVLNFGIATANNYGGKVLICDFNFTAPSLIKYSKDKDSELGIYDLINMGLSLKEIVTQGPCPNLDLLDSGIVPVDAKSFLASQNLSLYINKFRNSYDTVIIKINFDNSNLYWEALSQCIDGVIVLGASKSIINTLKLDTDRELNPFGFVEIKSKEDISTANIQDESKTVKKEKTATTSKKKSKIPLVLLIVVLIASLGFIYIKFISKNEKEFKVNKELQKDSLTIALENSKNKLLNKQSSDKAYLLRVISTRNKANALALIENLNKNNYIAYYTYVTLPKGAYYRVYVVGFGSKEEAKAEMEKLNKLKLGIDREAQIDFLPYTIFVDFVKDKMEATTISAKMDSLNYCTYYFANELDQHKIMRVMIGGFDKTEDAASIIDIIKKSGYNDAKVIFR